MNCAEIIKGLGFRCQALSESDLRIWSPFTYGEDGQVVALYVERHATGYRITDNAESLMHASAMGAHITRSKIASLKRCVGTGVTISSSGEISASATPDELPNAVAQVLNASMAVGHFETIWRPRSSNSIFTDAVGGVLTAVVGERLKRQVPVQGASGHQIEIPFVIEDEYSRTYLQPVAYGDDRVNWDNVYRGLGKMLDLKNIGAGDTDRVVVLQDAADDELAKAVTLIGVAAKVVYFSRLQQWARMRVSQHS